MWGFILLSVQCALRKRKRERTKKGLSDDWFAYLRIVIHLEWRYFDAVRIITLKNWLRMHNLPVTNTKRALRFCFYFEMSAGHHQIGPIFKHILF